MSYPFYNGVAPHQASSRTSTAAAVAITGQTLPMRQQVYNFIYACWNYGATCDEVEIQLKMRHQTASARIRELAISGAIGDSGYVRKQSSGLDGVVWRITGPYVADIPRHTGGKKPPNEQIHRALLAIAQAGPMSPDVHALCTWLWNRYVV